MLTTEWIAGLYLAACLIIAIGCWYVATTRRQHPLMVAALGVLFALLLRQAWRVAVPNTSVPASAEFVPLAATMPASASVPLAAATTVAISEVAIPEAPGAMSVPAPVPVAAQGQALSSFAQIAPWQALVEQAGRECGVDAALIAAVMRQESNGDAQICSKAGACGLMQLMPETALQMGVADRFDPAQNVRGGACYLRQMLERYGNDLTLALAGYNAGPGNVDQYGGVPPFAETQTYIRNVLTFYAQLTSPMPSVMIWPVRGTITQQPSARHMALDIATALGTPIGAAAGGQVVAVGWAGDYGKRVIIEHGNGLNRAERFLTLYAHLSSFAVEEGQQISQGQLIGRIGSTGKSTGPHLHFEVRQEGVLQNPWHYLSAGP